MDDETIRKIYKNFRNQSPTIIFRDVAKEFTDYYKNLTKEKKKITVSAKMDIRVVRELLAYSLVVEAPVLNYKKRINEHFGWA